MEPANENGEHWPPSEVREGKNRHLNKLRHGIWAAFVVLVVLLIGAATLHLMGFWSWFWSFVTGP